MLKVNPKWHLYKDFKEVSLLVRDDIIIPDKENNYHGRLWTKLSIGSQQSKNYQLVLNEVNCKNKTIASLDVIDYKNGRITERHNPDKPVFEHAIPDTLDEDIVEIVCSHKGLELALGKFESVKQE